MELNDLIKGCQQKERRSQHEIYNMLKGKMFAVCMRYAKNQPEAEDILQDGFIKVFTKIDQFKFEGSFEGWVRRIMVNTALENYRRNSRMFTVTDIEEALDHSGTEETISRISAQDLTNDIQDLPTGYKTVFNLYAIEGYNHKEIGELLGINENTSKSQYSRARTTIQKMIAKQGIETSYGKSI